MSAGTQPPVPERPRSAHEHHDAAIEQLSQARKMMDHVAKMLADANGHLLDAHKCSPDPGRSHMSAYMAGFVTTASDNAKSLQVLIGRATVHTANVRDAGQL